MYERILDADWIKVDYYNDGKPMIRVSEFVKGKWIDFYCDIPVGTEPIRDCHWATEVAYKNGYEAGKRDAVVHGRWIDAREYCGDYMCSNCDALYRTNKFNYCPSCGAKMKMEVESEE